MAISGRSVWRCCVCTFCPISFFLPVQQIFIGPYCKPSLGMNFLFVLDEGSKYTEVNNI